MDIEVEATIEGYATCPECGHLFEVELTKEITVTIEPEDDTGDPD